MAKFIIEIFETELQGENDEKLSDCGTLIFSARSKRHVMDDLTCKLIAELDRCESPQEWYLSSISICDTDVPVVNFINGNINDVCRLTKDQIKHEISQMRILGFGQVRSLRRWIAANLKAYH